MDRFKFRVFCKSRGDYVEKMLDLTIYYDGSLVEYDGLEQDMDNHIIEQCTGLKDRNGNLIYEGDLLFDGEFCGVVVWKDSSWQVRFELYDGDSGYERLDQHFAKFGQIYGNIHEQKENQ